MPPDYGQALHPCQPVFSEFFHFGCNCQFAAGFAVWSGLWCIHRKAPTGMKAVLYCFLLALFLLEITHSSAALPTQEIGRTRTRERNFTLTGKRCRPVRPDAPATRRLEGGRPSQL
jgi:hypothetical protein